MCRVLTQLKQNLLAHSQQVDCNALQAFELTRSFESFLLECRCASLPSLMNMVQIIKIDMHAATKNHAPAMAQFHGIYWQAANHIYLGRLH